MENYFINSRFHGFSEIEDMPFKEEKEFAFFDVFDLCYCHVLSWV